MGDPHCCRRGRHRRDRLVATRDDDATPADQPSPTVTVPPTVPPRALLNDRGRRRSCPGRTTSTRSTESRRRGSSSPSAPGGDTSPGDGTALAAGWSGPFRRVETPTSASWGLANHPAPCSQTPATGRMGITQGAVTTLDGLADALTEQQGWAAVTAPSDISIDGYAGKQSNAPPPPTCRTATRCRLEADSSRIRPNHGSPYEAFRRSEGGGGLSNRARSRSCGSSTSTAPSSSSARDSGSPTAGGPR